MQGACGPKRVNPVCFITASELAWQAALKKTKIKLELLTNIDILLMVENEIRGICYAIHQYANVNNKYIKYAAKNKESLYITY